MSHDQSSIHSRGTCVKRLRTLATVATMLSGCGVTPPPYQADAGVGNAYCRSFLRLSHLCATSTTITYLVCLCLAIVLGFLAAQLSNDPGESSLFKKHRSTFLFVGAAIAGVLGAYFHSRADAASKAAADVETALTRRLDWGRYKLCLAAAARWDGSRSESLDAANAVATDQNNLGTSKMLDSMQSASAARDRSLDATEEATKALSTLMGALEASSTGRPARLSKSSFEDARKALEAARASVAQAKRQSEQATVSLQTAKQEFSAEEKPPQDPTSTPVGQRPSRPDAGR